MAMWMDVGFDGTQRARHRSRAMLLPRLFCCLASSVRLHLLARCLSSFYPSRPSAVIADKIRGDGCVVCGLIIPLTRIPCHDEHHISGPVRLPKPGRSHDTIGQAKWCIRMRLYISHSRLMVRHTVSSRRPLRPSPTSSHIAARLTRTETTAKPEPPNKSRRVSRHVPSHGRPRIPAMHVFPHRCIGAERDTCKRYRDGQRPPPFAAAIPAVCLMHITSSSPEWLVARCGAGGALVGRWGDCRAFAQIERQPYEGSQEMNPGIARAVFACNMLLRCLIGLLGCTLLNW